MSGPLFPFSPTITATSRAVEFSVRKTDFGDHYAQRARAGLHTALGTWTVTLRNRPNLEVQEAIVFLTERAGATPFHFMHPKTARIHLVVCESFREDPTSNIRASLTATFQEVVA